MYTRGLWDTGGTFSATKVWHGDPSGVPCTIYGWRRWGAGLEPFMLVKGGPGRDMGPQPSLGDATTLWGQPCPRPS